ncbi:GNAT family N-acetyltransferase [Cryptosporangium phraense]|uniref:N-acetyltransferase n=1 Tax=Cryptosporangium phraense TaxID=2593070 RepID=A0A545AZI3_9ACTN|nr:GNAT family N-acetyltransferase [Cryptosporangium phraense]TQS46727.1 N-acetyltransferase [Cryptosporangium phraense]
MADELAISDVKDESRYEATLDGVVAGVVEYQLDGDVIMFTHTGVPSEFEGRGIASQLARYVLDDARSRGLDVLPRCPYIAGWIARHLEYLDLVPPASRVRYKLPAEA